MQCWPEVSPAAGRSPPSLNPLAFLAVTRIDPAEQPARQIRSCADAARTCRMMALCFNGVQKDRALPGNRPPMKLTRWGRSEEHTSELQSLMSTSYAVFCLKKKTKTQTITRD